MGAGRQAGGRVGCGVKCEIDRRDSCGETFSTRSTRQQMSQRHEVPRHLQRSGKVALACRPLAFSFLFPSLLSLLVLAGFFVAVFFLLFSSKISVACCADEWR